MTTIRLLGLSLLLLSTSCAGSPRASGGACDEEGCFSSVNFSLGADLVNGTSYLVKACVEAACESATIGVQTPSDDPATGRRVGASTLKTDRDEVHLRLPAGSEYPGRRDVSLFIRDEDGRVLVETAAVADFQQFQPNGSNCPPTCWIARVEV